MLKSCLCNTGGTFLFTGKGRILSFVAGSLMLKTLVIFALTGLLLFVSCSQHTARSGDKQFYTPVEYNDFIVDQQNAIIKRMIKLTATYDSGSNSEVRIQFDSLVKQSDISLTNIKRLSDYEGDSSLKLQAEQLFEFYNHIFYNEYRQMVEIFLKGSDASDEDITELNRIVQSVRVKEEALNRSLGLAQNVFAKKFDFDFQDSAETPVIEP